LKIGRNQLCYCVSQKKYKNCCLRKDSKPTSKDVKNEISSLLKKSKIKECFHPQRENCKGKISKAHAIQNNKILSKISEDGKVVMIHYTPKTPVEFAHIYGRKQATTFSGFCNYHDQEVFKDIDNKEFQEEIKQIFQYAYKAFVSEYYKKITDCNFSGNFANSNDIYKYLEKGQQMAVYDFLAKKLEFDNAIINENFNCLVNVVWEFDKEVNFAACGYYAPIVDLERNLIQDLEKDEIVSHIYFNVFPESGRSIALLSWLKSDGKNLLNLQKQLNSLSGKEREYYISNLVIDNTDNIVIKPSSWENLNEVEKQTFGMHEMRMFWQTESGFMSMIEEPEVNLFDL